MEDLPSIERLGCCRKTDKADDRGAESVKFPKAIDKKYSSETPAKGRLHTCVDAYHVAKDAGTLGDLKWIQKGGGYWSLCNTSIKAAG